MSQTTAVPEIPAHYQEAIDLAEKAKWTVERKNLSVSLVPPKGVRQTLSLARPQAPLQLQANLQKWGLVAAAKKQEQTAPTPPVKTYICPECSRTFTRGAAMGSHRKSHGVDGARRKTALAAKKPVKAKTATSSPKTAPAAANGSGVAVLTAQFVKDITRAMQDQINEKDARIAELTARVEELQTWKNKVLGAVTPNR